MFLVLNTNKILLEKPQLIHICSLISACSKGEDKTFNNHNNYVGSNILQSSYLCSFEHFPFVQNFHGIYISCCPFFDNSHLYIKQRRYEIHFRAAIFNIIITKQFAITIMLILQFISVFKKYIIQNQFQSIKKSKTKWQKRSGL